MVITHKIGISSFTYCFACGSRPFEKPERVLTPLELIDKAVAIGADVVQFGDNIIGGIILRIITDKDDFAPDLPDLCRILSSVIPQLEESGVVLGIENHDRFSANEYVQMVETVNHPQVRLTIDTVNSLSHEEYIDEVLKYMAPYCVCLHMKDYVIKRYNGGGGLKITGACLGTGRLDIRRCDDECRMRSDRNFNIILESWMEPCETLEETLRAEDEWARAGVAYLRTII